MLVENFKELAEDNENFRRVLKTEQHCQLVAMHLRPGEDIGEEVHDTTDQLFIIARGCGEVLIGEETMEFDVDDIILVPAGNLHNVTNTGAGELKLLTVYAPPEHPEGTIEATKAWIP